VHRTLILSALLLGSAATAFAAAPETLLISPGDLLHLQVADTPEMEEHARVTDTGEIPVLGIGNVKVGGLTPGDAAITVHDELISAHYLNHPQVSIVVEQYATQNVSVIGEVRGSGVYPITTPRPVLDVLALAGGLNPDADRHILIERQGDKERPVPYYVSNNGQQAIASQIMVNPGDTVVVPKAGIVYILGDVNRPGGYVMSNNESELSLLQGLALAGGVTKSAKQGHARLIRKHPDGSYTDQNFSVGNMQQGKLPDMALLPGDILYIPFSYARNIATSGASGIIASTASASLYVMP
jgi:polysaccharide export outer membrane protein